MTTLQSREFQLDTGNLVLRTRAAEMLGNQAQAVLQTVASLQSTPRGIQDGSTVEFGGALFVLAQSGDALHVCEPNYLGQPEGQDLNGDITRSLLVLVQQLQFAKAVGVTPTACSFRQSLTAPKSLDWSKKIYLQRDPPQGQEDSGWFVGSAEETGAPPSDDQADYHKLPVHALIKLRPGAMRALILPPGYIAVVEGDNVVGVADQNNNEVWKAEPKGN